MQVVSETVDPGDVIELGESVEVVDLNGSHVRAVTSGPTEEFVVLQEPLESGELEVATGSQILGVRQGKAMASDSILVAVPRGEYE